MKQLLLKIENCFQCKFHGYCSNENFDVESRCYNYDWPETRLIENPKVIPEWCKLEDYKYDSMNDVIKGMTKKIEDSNKKHKEMFNKLAENLAGDEE